MFVPITWLNCRGPLLNTKCLDLRSQVEMTKEKQSNHVFACTASNADRHIEWFNNCLNAFIL